MLYQNTKIKRLQIHREKIFCYNFSTIRVDNFWLLKAISKGATADPCSAGLALTHTNFCNLNRISQKAPKFAEEGGTRSS